MVGAVFFAWWLEQLADLLPPWLRRAVGTAPDALLATLPAVGSEAHVQFTSRRSGIETPLGEFALAGDGLASLPRQAGRPVALRLARADLLEKLLILPIAAQSELKQVLAFEMDRETPFAVDEVYWTHAIEAIDRARGRLSVRLMLIPKARLAPLLRALAARGIAPNWAEIADGPPECRYLPLDGDSGLPQSGARRLLRPLAATCGLLALTAAATPFVRQSLALSSLDAKLRAGQTKAAQAESLRRQIGRLSHSAGIVADELHKAGRPLEIVATLTRLLPDDTYLTELELRHGKLTVSGRSANAARLIGILAGEGKIRNPTFTAPVTRLDALKAEVFTIVGNAEPQS